MKRKVWILILMAVMGVAANLPANASLILGIDPAYTAHPGQIQYFWSNATNKDANAPDNTDAIPGARYPNDTAGDVSLAIPARTMDEPTPSYRWLFWAGSDQPGSQTIYLRMWDSATRDHFYTNLGSHANPAAGGDTWSYGVPSYTFIKAKPATPVITTIEDKGTTDLTVTPATLTRTVTFKSSAPRVGTKLVEIAQSIWNVNGTDRTASPGLDLTLSAAAGDDLTAGTRYTVRVKHVNLWGGADGTSTDYSGPQTYEIGAGVSGTGGGVTSITLVLVSTGMGINQFTLPFVPAYRGTNEIRTIAQLVAQINAAPGGDVVRSIGWWDSTSQIDMGFVVSGGSLTPVNTTLDPATTALETNKAYQITVSGAKTVTLNSTSTP